MMLRKHLPVLCSKAGVDEKNTEKGFELPAMHRSRFPHSSSSTCHNQFYALCSARLLDWQLGTPGKSG
jgi:hypothetical protein